MVYFIIQARLMGGNLEDLTRRELHTRTVGFIPNKKTAEYAVKYNIADLYENGFYPIVIIEGVEGGLYPAHSEDPTDGIPYRKAFIWNKDKKCFIEHKLNSDNSMYELDRALTAASPIAF